ncbi:hypothetical protein B0H13DRAFT_1856001 [Mycena leptocephala]|nr:hypothetical protein B0H13DRAFT_1856001 [Mycena leptocephala]
MGSNLTHGFGIVASVPLLSWEYIYELMGLMSSDGNAKHTRLSEIEAAGKQFEFCVAPSEWLTTTANRTQSTSFSESTLQYLNITGCELGLIVRTCRAINPGEEITLNYSGDYFDHEEQCPCRTCQITVRAGSGSPVNEEDSRTSRELKQRQRRQNNASIPRQRKTKAERIQLKAEFGG